MKKLYLATVMLVLTVCFSFAQETETPERIITANDYLNTVSTVYEGIADYEAKVTITKDKETMSGILYYKDPSLLRINFENPEDQVLVVGKERLVIHIPKYRVTMSQKLKKGSGVSDGAAMAGSEGLKLLRRNYTVAYLESPGFVPLDEGSEELVIKLKFVWRSSDEGFRQIILSVDQNNLIRRLVGVTSDYAEIKFDFTDIKTNQNIPDTRFEYDSPASANTFENFLFEAE